jgi:membrane-bound lytic murein transglycosylase D
MIRSIVALLCFLTAAPAFAQSLTAAVARPPKGGVTLCGEPVPLKRNDVRERFEKEMLLSLGDRPQVLLWLKRSKRYLPFITQALKKEGLPEDLKYLTIVESALRPHAGSSRGAIGFWQLLPETARKYGLTVDEYIDQRRDIFLSTPAALSYLKALHTKFSSWTLALAAYNMGEEGLDAEILEQKTNDYYQLYLPLETQQFVLRILAVKLIVSHPRKYGFKMAPEDYYQPLQFDTAKLDCFQEVPLRLVAEAAHTSFKVIKDLNPSLRGHYLEAGHHELRVPPGGDVGFAGRFQKLAQNNSEQRMQRIYVVQSGDSLSTIADKFNVPVAALLIWNRIDLNKPLYPGNRLVIYPRTRPRNGIEADEKIQQPSSEGDSKKRSSPDGQ